MPGRRGVLSLHQALQGEARRSREALLGELDQWASKARSVDLDNPLANNATQVLRLTHTLRTAAQALGGAEETLEGAAALLDAVGAGHRIWDFYREKLTQRSASPFRDAVVLADDIARACYQPALDRWGATLVVEAAREPPLVAFASRPSPYLQPRGSLYVPPGLDPRFEDDFRSILLSMPVSLVGMPWRQWNEPAAFAAIAHEVGHAVEEDFHLTDRIREVVRGTAPRPAEAWDAWAPELFADAWGIAHGGSAYLGALARALAGPVTGVRAETRQAPDWGEHPTALVRMDVALGVLRALDLPDPKGIAGSWYAAYGSDPGAVARRHGEEAAAVGEALATAPWLGEASLGDLVDGAALEAGAQQLAGGIAKGRPLPGGTDPRALVRALDRLDDAHRGFDRVLALLGQWRNARPGVDPRSALVPAGAGGLPEARIDQALGSADRARGERIAHTLMKLARR